MKYSVFLLLTLLGMCISDINAQEAPTYQWLSGSWTGDGFGGFSDESWTLPAKDGSMTGVYRHLNADGSVNFYEILLLDKSGLRLKHFNSDLHSWEDKEEMVRFEMIRYDEKTIELKGLKFQYFEPDSMEIHLNMKTKEGSKTEVFHMKRVN